MRRLIVLMAVLVAAPAAAQVQSRPTDPPQVTAVDQSWYQLREAVPFSGDLYYPAGAAVFYNGNSMVRTGQHNGVPLYADTTLEPYSVVLVPIGRGLLQPYERPRRGDLAGTTGSRTPSFPGALRPTYASVPGAAASPTATPVVPGALTVLTPGTSTPDTAPAAAPVRQAAREAGAVGTGGIVARTRPVSGPPIVSLRAPESNDGIWIRFLGEKWVSAGAAVPYVSDDFTHVGEYGTFPVFRRRDRDERIIYIPTRAGLVAPYGLKRD